MKSTYEQQLEKAEKLLVDKKDATPFEKTTARGRVEYLKNVIQSSKKAAAMRGNAK